MLYAFLTFLVLAASPLLWWVRKTFTFWRDKGIAHLTFWQYLRFLYDIFTKPLNEVLHRNYKRYGRVYGSYQGTAPTLVVGDPDIIREVLVTKFQNFSDKSAAQRIGSDVWCKAIDNLSGDEWKTARNIFTPALTATGLRTIVVKIKTIAEKLTSRIVDAASQDEPVNLSELSFYTALDTAAALNYSIELDSKNDPNHALIRCLEGIYMNEGGWKVLMLFFMPSVFKALQPDYPKKESTDVFRAFVSHLIQERKSKEKEEDDFLQVFMNADYDWERAGNNKSENTEKKKMSLDEITAQGISFFIGGVEGGSMTLALSAYYLALHPECQDRAIAEVDKTLSEGDITYDALQQMSYLEACIKEALRICTPDNMWVRKTFYFWNDKNVVHHTFWQYLRFCVDIYTKPLHEVLIRNYKEHGRIYGSYQGTKPILVVGDTDILRDVMVSKFKNFSERAEAQQIGSDAWRNSIFTLSGAQWKKARTIFTPAMTTIRMKARRWWFETLQYVAKSLIKVMAGETHQHFRSTTPAYGPHLNPLKKQDAIFRETDFTVMTPCVYKILQPGFLNKSSTGMFTAFVSHLIDERKSKNKKEDDFLQLFMDADYEWENSEEKQEQTAQKRTTLCSDIISAVARECLLKAITDELPVTKEVNVAFSNAVVKVQHQAVIQIEQFKLPVKR
ncbi:hypothetical protein V5799_026363 [Amblyomma americanum]|uniref:Cytochrome n=1 Tax=Amblyomma americanum TaxID=6943 RepID=A0AAQ4DIT3_AMBAM